MRFVRPLLAFVAAVVVTFVIASVVHTHFVIQRLVGLGVDVPQADALRTVGGDLAGLAPAFGPVIAITLLLGFGIAVVVRRFLPALAPIAFPTAGAAAMATMLALMHMAFKMTPIAGARDPGGWWLICLSGAVGGALFAQLAKARRA
ncbi:MAG: hypothetical protein INF91_09145 [Alphaproteobacteria bacterium]|nr:hypothetical protein [Alphaproteobacteria bacterium]